jgi:phage shock protein PspC (stress-responsive transcriptional regulator)
MKHLYRSKKHRLVAGVAGGLAEYFGIDPILVRLVFILLFFVPPAVGFWLYLAGIIFIPEEGEKEKEEKDEKEVTERLKEGAQKVSSSLEDLLKTAKKDTFHRRRLLGAFLVLLGVLFMLDRLFLTVSPSFIWGLLFIFIGFILLVNRR